jgi:hypothetical protein
MYVSPPKAWAQICYEYENTDRPVEDICAEHGISSGTLRDRIRRWNLRRRRRPIPRERPPALVIPQLEYRPVIDQKASMPRFTSPHWGEVDARSASGEGVPIYREALAPSPQPSPPRGEGAGRVLGGRI